MRSAILYCLRCGASLKGAKRLDEHNHYAEGRSGVRLGWPKSGKQITFECPQCHAPQTRRETSHWFN